MAASRWALLIEGFKMPAPYFNFRYFQRVFRSLNST